MPRATGVGSLIFEAGSGYVPGLAGRLSPIRDIVDEADRFYLYADNISVNDQPYQPFYFTRGQPVLLEDAQGVRAVVTIVELIGRSSLMRLEQ